MDIWLKDFIYNHVGEKIKPTLQQLEILDDIKNYRFTYFLKSRQIGFTLILCNYLAHYLINNTDKMVISVGHNFTSSKSNLRLIERIIKINSNDSIYKSKTNLIEMINGSRIMAITTSVDSLRGFNFDLLVIDEWFNETFLATGLTVLNFVKDSQLILGLTPINWYQVNYFNKKDNNFYRKKLHYSSSELWDNNKIENIKNAIGPEHFKYEYDLDIDDIKEPIEDKTIKEKNKTRFLQFRVDDDLEYKLLEKLSREDITLSNYLRNLIKKDLNI